VAAQRVFAVAAFASALLATLGSWAPLRVRETNLADVWEVYLNANLSPSISRADFVANILLGIPFAYTLLGFLTTNRQRDAGRLAATLVTMAAAIVLAVIVELGQGWFLGRVPSVRDSLAQVCGATIGCVAWWITGDRISRLLNRMLLGDKPHSRLQAAISLTALGVLAWSLLPGNVLVSPVDLARKWTDGNIELIPFTRPQASFGESIYQWMASIFLAIPLGLWASQFLKFTLRRSTSLTEKALIACGAGLLPETLQIPIASRVASSTDALFGVIGAGLGICIGDLIWKNATHVSQPRPSHPIRQPAFWYLMAALYFVFLCVLSWYPFDFETHPRRILKILKEVASDPFSDYQGSNLKTLFVFARLAVISTILGVLAGIGTGLIRQQPVRIAVAVVIFLATAAGSLAIELGQLLESTHSGAGLGLVMRMLATWSGLALGIVASRGRSLFADPNQRGSDSIEPTVRSLQPVTDSAGAVKRDLYVPGMDGLRALACLAVFGVHWEQLTSVGSKWGPFDNARLLENGNTGVAMFMILSGFLLALPVFSIDPKSRLRYGIGDFGLRRAAKILPAYYFCLFALVLVKTHLRSVRQWLDVLMHSTFLHNLSPNTLYGISPPFWALAPIVQFYAFFALVLAALRFVGRCSDRAILGTFAAICLGSQLLTTALTLADPGTGSSEFWMGPEAVCLQHSLASHACIFGFGIFAAWAHRRLPERPSRAADLIFLSCMIATLVILSTPLDNSLNLPGGRYHFPVVPLMLTSIVLAAPRGTLSRRLLEWPAIRRLGVISYAFYLFHLPVMQFVKIGFEQIRFSVSAHPTWFAFISLGLTVITSELVYRMIERPAGRLFLAPLVRDTKFKSDSTQLLSKR
jgi:peptidoglycan/LPS O-acetylase OafA/YrhL/VanZ family protein